MITAAGFEFDYFEILDKSDITDNNPKSVPIVASISHITAVTQQLLLRVLG